MDTVRSRGANLLTLVGGYLHHPPDRQANILYDLVHRSDVDGVVIRGHLCVEADAQQEMAFYQHFEPLPCVVIGRQADTVPHLLMDGYTGMRDAIIHLIETHGCRRIAFFRGPELFDANERYRAYVDVLREYEIPFDPRLVTPLLSAWDSDEDALTSIHYLFDQQVPFDAIVTASDMLAHQTIPHLKQRGIRIPEDVAVIGFNNMGNVTTPRLTSVDGGFYDQGKRATEMLFSVLDGQPVPDRVLLPTRLHVRQSCGCLDLEVVRAAAGARVLAASAASAPAVVTSSFQSLSRLKILAKSTRESWHETLLNNFIDEIDHQASGAFLQQLDSMLRAATASGEDLDIWHNRLSMLREQILPCIADTWDTTWAEDLFQQARVLVSQAMLWEQSKKRKEAQERTNLLYEISQSLVTTFDTTELMNVLARELPRLGIPRAYIALYENPEKASDSLRLRLAYDTDGRYSLPDGVAPYPTSQFVPCDILSGQSAYSLVVEPLYFREEQMGLAIFETGPREGSIYDMLRGQISSALKGSHLFSQNIQLVSEAKAAQKSAEEANRLKSRFLASVSHELRTPLNMLIGLSEMLLEEPSNDRPPLPTLYRQDLERINTSAHHLDDLLRDVLDLTRSQVGRLKLVRKPIDLRDVLVAVGALVEPIIIQKELRWQVDMPDTIIPVWGDAARLKQVLLNLIHNAVKFTATGQITMLVEAGKGEVTISISDTGLGIPLEDQELIFDEFHTTERSAARGYGGIGLGLAVCRRLVEMHSGRIGARSPGGEGSGSTFYFTLPTMSHYPDKLPPQELPHKQTVLLLREANRQPDQHLENHLLREGFEIDTLILNDQFEATVSPLLARHPALIILDVEVESQRSQLVMRLVKQYPGMQDVPILFYSLFQEQNAGSIFMLDYLSKPVNTGSLARALARYGLEDQQQPMTILVVDDDRTTLDMNIHTVQVQLPGCRVLEAREGRTALHLMRQYKPDLVLLDLMMPEYDGFDVLVAMQKDETIRHIPTIVLTAMTLTEEDMSRLSQGVASILSKGLFSVDETLAHIENALARNRHLGSEAQRTVRKVIAYIHQHYAEPIARREMAAYAGVSERHLDRCFQQDTGITPVSYLNRYRVQQAKKMLTQTSKSLTEIALAVGFSSSTHFGRVFRREVGQSPSAYQNGKH